MDILARVTIQKVTENPEDSVVNTLAYNFPVAPNSGDFNTLTQAIADFYNGVAAAQINPISEYLSGTIFKGVDEKHTVTYYEIAHPFPGLGNPLFEETFAIPLGTGISSVNFPEEVASCLSFRANYAGLNEVVSLPPTGPEGDEHPRARVRGRIFVGPLNAGASDTGTLVIPRPSDLFRADLVKSGAQHLLVDASQGNWSWSVWSRANDELRSVGEGWVDDAWDTQRRRGVDATTRTTFT